MPVSSIVPGDTFGSLTVESDSGKRKNGYRVWTCRCGCGKTIDIDARTLKRGTATDCGCVTKLSPRQRDLTGQRFGMLTAEYCTGKTGACGSYIWHLKCDCGGEVDAPLSQLKAGYRKSCGCLSSPPLKDFEGRTFGRLTVTGYAGKWDGSHHWECACGCGNTVTVTQSNLQSGHTKSCGCLPAEGVKERLKLVQGTSVTILETRLHRLNANNKSGHTGVFMTKRTGKWSAQITFMGKTYHLGTFDDKEDAIKARVAAESMHEDFIEWYYSSYACRKPQETRVPASAQDGRIPATAADDGVLSLVADERVSALDSDGQISARVPNGQTPATAADGWTHASP